MKTQILTPDLIAKADQICTNYPVKRAALLPVLRLVQDAHGCISPEAEVEVSEFFDVSAADVREVVTFYTLFYSKPKGQCHVQLCRTLTCHLKGAPDLLEHFEKKLAIKAGETTQDGAFSLDTAECLGACEIAPMAQVGKDYVGPLTKEKLDEIIATVSS